jgi:hypothetical protein
MKKLVASIMTVALMSIGLNAANLELISDSELESVSAQGFHINFQTVDTVLNSATGASAPSVLEIGNVNNLIDSVLISGNAQQNAFVPVNASNSAVNVPINIVIIMNSRLGGGVKISNILNAAVNP